MNNDINIFLDKINIKANNLDVYQRAFTHSSFNVYDRNKQHNDYERIEFMGDAVIEFCVSDILFKLYPTLAEGDLTRIRAYMVKSKTLAQYARKLNLADYIISSLALTHEQVANNDNILEDVFESLVGAIYLDQGIEKAFNFVHDIFYEDIKNIDLNLVVDAKTKLQELMQAEYHELVHYEVVEMSGPAHDRTFKVNVMFNDIVLATGIGKTKKAAEEEAARNALKKGVM